MMHGEKKRLEITKTNLMEDKSISKNNKEIINEFLDEITAAGISTGRVQKYCYYLMRISQILEKDFPKATKEDIVRILNELEKATVRNGYREGKPLSDWGKHDYKVVIKRFYKWLRNKEIEEYNKTHKDKKQSYGIREYPDEVKWFAITFPRKKRRKPRNLIKEPDVKKIMNAANNTRDKLFVHMLWETGARIGELLTLTLDGIEFKDEGVWIQIYGKTGERKILLKDSWALLSAWMEQHPRREGDKSKLFCGINGNNPSYDYWRILLKRLAKKAGVTKPVNPHYWRHSRATFLSKHLTEQMLCYYMGWVPGSSQPGTYVHLEGSDLGNAILKMHGIKVDEEKVERKEPITCPRCKTVNDSLSKVCTTCYMILDEKSMMEYYQQKEEANKVGMDVNTIINNPVMLKQMIDLLSDKLEKISK